MKIKIISILGFLAFFLQVVESSVSSSSSCSSSYDSSSSSSSDEDSINISDLRFEVDYNEAVPDSNGELFNFDSGISLNQIGKLRKSLAEDRVFKTYANAGEYVKLSTLLESAEIATNAEAYNYVFKIFARPVELRIDPMLSTALSFVRAKIFAKYKITRYYFKLSEWHLCFYAYLETGINLINQLTASRLSKKETKKILKYDFRTARYSLDQLLEVMDKYGVVPQSTFAGPFDERVVNDLQHVLNQFIFQAHLQLKRASESELAKLKQDLVISLFRLLSVKIGVPPKEFSYNLDTSRKTESSAKFEKVTPKEFYYRSGGKSRHQIIQFGNDPALEYYKTYTYSKQKCLTEGKGFTFINVPMEVMNRIAVDALMRNGRITHFTHYISGHESFGKKVFDRNLFAGQEDLAPYTGLSRSDSLKYSVLTRSSGILWSLFYDLEKNSPVQWKLETPFGMDACVRNNYFLENGLILAVEKFEFSPEIEAALAGPAIVISDKFSKLA